MWTAMVAFIFRIQMYALSISIYIYILKYENWSGIVVFIFVNTGMRLDESLYWLKKITGIYKIDTNK